MVKFAVLVILGFVAYGLIKRSISSGMKERAEKQKMSAHYVDPKPETNSESKAEPEEARAAHQETVFDSICMSYIPLDTAVGATVNKKTHYFCSEFCRRTYVNSNVYAPY